MKRKRFVFEVRVPFFESTIEELEKEIRAYLANGFNIELKEVEVVFKKRGSLSRR